MQMPFGLSALPGQQSKGLHSPRRPAPAGLACGRCPVMRAALDLGRPHPSAVEAPPRHLPTDFERALSKHSCSQCLEQLPREVSAESEELRSPPISPLKGDSAYLLPMFYCVSVVPCGIQDLPHLGIEPTPTALGVCPLNHWATKEVLLVVMT